MVTNKVFKNKYEQHIFLSRIAEEIGRFGHTDTVCPVCDGEFTLERKGSSYVLKCETEGCLKFTSRGI